MNRRDTHFLPGMPSVPRGHARNVGIGVLGWPAGAAAAMMGFGLCCFPGGMFGWAVVAVVGGIAIWRATRPGFEQGISVAALVARLSWVGAALALVPFYAALLGALSEPVSQPLLDLGRHPATWLVFDGMMLSFAWGMGRHLSSLARVGSDRRSAVNTVLAGSFVGVVAHVLALGLVLPPYLDLVAQGHPGFGPTLALGALACLTHSPLLIGGGWLMATFWTDRDAAVNEAFAKTRLSGSPATWTPFGFHWSGVAHPGEWRVVAETARVPAALRIEVTVPGLTRLRIRRREDQEPASGVPLADPVLSSTLVVDGMEEADVEVLLDGCHESLLPAVHGLGAVLERGVMRVDLWVPTEGVGDAAWLAEALGQLVSAVDGLQENLLEAQPRTDEVIRQLEEISARQGAWTDEHP